jgi:hypothetical protein
VLKERERALKYLIDCGIQPMLIRVDDPRALEVGAAMGISAYQGFHIDAKMEGREAPAAQGAG